MTADDDMHDKHGLPPRPPQPGRDEGPRETRLIDSIALAISDPVSVLPRDRGPHGDD